MHDAHLQNFIKLFEVVDNDISVLIQYSQSNEEVITAREIVCPNALTEARQTQSRPYSQ
jgi:hypothetical protein